MLSLPSRSRNTLRRLSPVPTIVCASALAFACGTPNPGGTGTGGSSGVGGTAAGGAPAAGGSSTSGGATAASGGAPLGGSGGSLGTGGIIISGSISDLTIEANPNSVLSAYVRWTTAEPSTSLVQFGE